MNSTNPINPNPEYIEKQFILSFKLSTIQSFILTFLAELGDKTFIMLIILQLKTNKVTILFSSLFAELLMNIIAIFIGWTIDYMLYKNLIDYCGILFFLVYGIWLLGEIFRTKKETFESELLSANKNFNNNNEQNLRFSSPVKTTELAIIEEEEDEIDENEQPLLKKDNNNTNNNNKFKNNKSFSYVEKNNIEDIYEKERREEEQKIKEETIDFKIFCMIFKRMMLSEFGDRTQWSSLIMGSIFNYRGVLLGSCFALILTCIIGVYFGNVVIKNLHESSLSFILGCVLLGYAFQIYAGK